MKTHRRLLLACPGNELPYLRYELMDENRIRRWDKRLRKGCIQPLKLRGEYWRFESMTVSFGPKISAVIQLTLWSHEPKPHTQWP